MINDIKKILEEISKKYKDPKNKKYIRKDEFIEDTLDFINYMFLNNKKALKNFKKRKKGKDYEKFIGEYFEKQGYQVLYNGIHEGLNDNKIDVIAIKASEIIFIQCKNWKNTKYKINIEYIKKFLYSCKKWIKENRIETFEWKSLLVTTKPILEKEAYKFIKNSKKIDLKIIPFNN